MTLPNHKETENLSERQKKFAVTATVTAQNSPAPAVFRLTLAAPAIAAGAVPGQFVMVRLENNSPVTLRRPLGLATADKSTGQIELIYRVMGEGTAALSELKAGEKINVLGSLGQGFAPPAARTLLVGGGMGLSPLLCYAQSFPAQTDILMGGKNAKEMFWSELFSPFVNKTYITTDDGSLGQRGFTVSMLPELIRQNNYDLVLAVGPEVMMRKAAEICREFNVKCQISLERRMACGLGACLSCSFTAVSGARRRVCHDGPVFYAEEVYNV